MIQVHMPERRPRSICTFALVLATVLASALMLAAGQSGSNSGSAVTEIEATRDYNYRWGGLQIAINPKNPQNIVYAIMGVGFTKKC
jgi:hypothetical protein